MLNETREYFNRLADQWDDLMPAQTPDRYLTVLRKLNLQPDEIVLDVGTGTGVMLEHIFALHPSDHVYAVDVSEAMIRQCTRKYPFFKNLICADAACVPLPDASVDAIICFAAFPHFAEPSRYIKEFDRLLRSGGRALVLHFFSAERLNAFHRSLPPPICHHILPSLNNLSLFFSDAGFHVIELTENEHLYLALFAK